MPPLNIRSLQDHTIWWPEKQLFGYHMESKLQSILMTSTLADSKTNGGMQLVDMQLKLESMAWHLGKHTSRVQNII